jgi:pyrophosphatase PpaX
MNTTTALLFDVDGTLLDTRDFIIKATEHALATHGHPVPERSVIARLVGQPFDQYYETLTGLKDNKVLQDTHRIFQLANLHLSVLFPGVVETLVYLKNKGYELAVVTTRSKKTSLETLRQAQIDPFFNVIISAEDATEVKPHPAPLFKALEGLGVAPQNAIMIGDTQLDVLAGKNAGTQTVRVTYGFHTDNLHEPEPDFIINTINELQTIL